MNIIWVRLLGVLIMLHCLVSFVFLMIVSIKPDEPNKNKPILYGIYGMTASSFVFMILSVVFVLASCPKQ